MNLDLFKDCDAEALKEIEELQVENERLKNKLEQSEFWEKSWHEKCENLEDENERFKKELNEVGNRERIFQDSLSKSFCEKQNLRKENEQLKRELKQTEVQDQVVIDGLRKENARLKCLALHLFSNYFFDCYWNSKGLDPNRYLHLHEKYDEAYRKAKAKLRSSNG